MNYSPHTLIKEVPGTTTRDEDGNPVTLPSSDVVMGGCRCEDFDLKYLKGVSGEGITYLYRVISDINSLEEGDRVRAMDGDKVRGEGVVKKVKRTNYLNYQEIWLSK